MHFEHGEPITGRAIHDLLEAFDVTPLDLTRFMSISRNALYKQMRRPSKVLSPDLAKRIQTQRRSLQKDGRQRKREVVPRVCCRRKSRVCRKNIGHSARTSSFFGPASLNTKLSDPDCGTGFARRPGWGAIRSLMFWPEFFKWIGKGVFDTAWRPSEVAIDFLASDYKVSDSTIERIVQSAQ